MFSSFPGAWVGRQHWYPGTRYSGKGTGEPGRRHLEEGPKARPEHEVVLVAAALLTCHPRKHSKLSKSGLVQ
eukprot:2366386-Rhodomonas_salina.1